jgi:hypothetical protein
MGPLTDAELQQRLAASQQVRHYAQSIDRESAREMLQQRVAANPVASNGEQARQPASRTRRGKEPPGTFETILKSPVTRSVANTITRGLLGALLGTPSRRRR